MKNSDNRTDISGIQFLRKELWLSSYKENTELDMNKLHDENDFGFFDDADKSAKKMSLRTPCNISVNVNTNKEEITISIETKFELSSKKNLSNYQLAFETVINQSFKIFNFYDTFYQKDLDKFIVPKAFANELVYGTICNAIGIIEALPKRKQIKKFNLHLGDRLKSTIKQDIICEDEAEDR